MEQGRSKQKVKGSDRQEGKGCWHKNSLQFFSGHVNWFKTEIFYVLYYNSFYLDSFEKNKKNLMSNK